MPLWKSQELEYDSSGNITYIGKNTKFNADKWDSGWYIWKYTWTNGNLIKNYGPIQGSWNNRANLGWA